VPRMCEAHPCRDEPARSICGIRLILLFLLASPSDSRAPAPDRNSHSKPVRLVNLLCEKKSPKPTLRNTRRCRNLHFSAGEMEIPANVRSSWRGSWGDLLARRSPQILTLYTSQPKAKPSSRALPMRPTFLASPMTLTFTPACSSFRLREFSGRDPIASTTESACIVTSFPLESV
jgi:hypothetical protein